MDHTHDLPFRWESGWLVKYHRAGTSTGTQPGFWHFMIDDLKDVQELNCYSGFWTSFFLKLSTDTKPVIRVPITKWFAFYFHPFSHHHSRFTYEIAPVFVLMEQITLKKMREIVGWSNKDGDGIFSPGRLVLFFFIGSS